MEVKTLLAEAAALEECTLLVNAISDQVASMAKNIHTMGETADASVLLLRRWNGKYHFMKK